MNRKIRVNSRVSRAHRLFNTSLLRSALAKQLCDIEVHEVGVVENDRFDRAFHLVALMTVRRDDVQDFTGNTMLVSQGDAAERMPHLLSKFTLNDFARGVLVVLERFAHVGQQRTSDQVIALDRNAASERTFEHLDNRDALPRTRVKMLDKGHIDVASQEGELDRAKFVKGPAFPAAACGNGFVPY